MPNFSNPFFLPFNARFGFWPYPHVELRAHHLKRPLDPRSAPSASIKAESGTATIQTPTTAFWQPSGNLARVGGADWAGLDSGGMASLTRDRGESANGVFKSGFPDG
jgi:hypothetical protein